MLHARFLENQFCAEKCSVHRLPKSGYFDFINSTSFGALEPLRSFSEITYVRARFIQHPIHLVVRGLVFAVADDDHPGIEFLDGIHALQPALPATGRLNPSIA